MHPSTHFAVALQLLGMSTALPRNTPVELEARASDTYDYVIVGGGVTGLVVANRLTEDSKSRLRTLSTTMNHTNA